MSRCYVDDIPDEVSNELMDSMRVPSYKAIAVCLLKNDLHLYELGFMPHVSHWYRPLKDSKLEPSKQLDLL